MSAWTPDDAIAAHRLRVAGLSAGEIADRLPGRTAASVRSLFTRLRSKGVPVVASKATLKTTSKRRVYPPLVPLDVVKSEIDAGLSISAIAHKYGVGTTSVWKYAKTVRQGSAAL